MSFQRVYWKELEIVLTTAHRYGTRYQRQLSASLTSDQYDCLVEVLAAIAACLKLLPVNTPIE